MINQFVFVVGCQRSGTTLLRRLLACTTEIYEIPDETMFFRNYYGRYGTLNSSDLDRLLRDFAASYAFRTAGVTVEQLARSLQQGPTMSYGHVFRAFAELSAAPHTPQASIVVEKTPTHTHYAETILREIPESKFIGIVRSPYAVVASNMKYGTVRLKLLGVRQAKVLGGFWEWRRHYEELRRLRVCLPADRLLIVNYENMVRDVASTLNDINEFLGTTLCPHDVPFELDKSTINKYEADLTRPDIDLISALASRCGDVADDWKNRGDARVRRPMMEPLYSCLFDVEVFLADRLHPKYKQPLKWLRGDVITY